MVFHPSTSPNFFPLTLPLKSSPFLTFIVKQIVFFFKKFLLDLFFIYISYVIPFPSFPSKNPLSPLPAPQPTYSHSWSWHSPILRYRAFTGPRASLPIDD